MSASMRMLFKMLLIVLVMILLKDYVFYQGQGE